LGQLRLQVFSNLLYGAQAIQYFNFTGLVDPVSCEKLPAFELVKQVNSEVRAYSHVFAGCSILGVWHVGDSIPCGTKPLESMPHKKVKSLQISANGGVVALIENGSQTYLAIQNRDCINPAILDISFTGETVRHTLHGELQHDSKPITLSPGNLAIFAL
jgi:hypothetical protein